MINSILDSVISSLLHFSTGLPCRPSSLRFDGLLAMTGEVTGLERVSTKLKQGELNANS